jgi:opacity protein-like surface antigen
MNGLKVSATPRCTGPRQRPGLAVAALAVALMAPAAAFASAQVSGSQQAVNVNAQGSSIKEVLSALSQKFKLEFQSSANLDKPVSGTYQGSLQHVVARLLEGYNFFITTNQGTLEVKVLGTQNGSTTAGVQSAPVIAVATPAPTQKTPSFTQVQSPEEAQKPEVSPTPQSAAAASPSPSAEKAASGASAKPSSPDSAALPALLKVAEGPTPVPSASTAAGPVPKPATASMPTPTSSGAMPSISPTPATSANAPVLPMPTSSSPFPGIKPQTSATPGNSPAAGAASSSAPTPQPTPQKQ